MNTERIFNENGSGFIRTFASDKIEKVNPVEYYKNAELKQSATLIRDMLYATNPLLTSFLDSEYFEKKAKEMVVGYCEQCEKIEVNENFIELLQTERKKDQVRLLKGMTLDPDVLMSLIFKSYNDFNYLYSKYHFRNLPPEFEGKKLPKLFHLKEDGSVHKVGETELTDGQLKHIIENRKVIVSHFFEKDDIWHCFFLTYKSLGGKENWKDGQPHFHYISSAFGISKEDFVESMRTGNYKSTSVHIDLLKYGEQPNK
ncbi:MAG: hypothetical protein JJE55_13210 [Flavobacteriaceae bacterium]|nr:hypothetical protein [Flavobacteriaceae bacterium]